MAEQKSRSNAAFQTGALPLNRGKERTRPTEAESPYRILLVEDELPHVTLIKRAFGRESPQDRLVVCHLKSDAMAQLEQQQFDAIVVDYSLPDADGLVLLSEVRRLGLNMPVIVVTGRGDEMTAVGAMKLGASDYIIKSENYARTLPLVVHKAIESKRVEAQLAVAEARYRLLFELAPDAIGIIDDRMRFLDLNPKCAELSGYAKEDLLTMSALSLLAPEAAGTAKKLFEQLKRDGTLCIPECRLRQKSGAQIIVEVTAVALGGGAYQFIARDMTERKELEQQLIESQKMDSIGKLSSGIAHDFNNLLGAMLGYASLLKADLPPDSPRYGYLEVIESSAQRGAELTRQLLALGRGVRQQFTSVSLNRVIDEVVQLLSHTIDKRIEILPHCDESLATVEGDAGQLQQVLLNICLNARDAMNGKGKLVIESRTVMLDQVFVRTHMGLKPGPHVLISITDNGAGMDAETQRHIFEPFFTTKTEGAGTGLGLAMAYSIVKNHRGTIRVYSELGQGTTFQIYLPASEQPERVSSSPQFESRGGTEVILVVDDEIAIRNLLGDTLGSAGYKVVKTQNGVQALSFVEQGKEPQLVILDMVMPEMDGKETYQRLRARLPGVKVLFSSGFSKHMTQDLLKDPLAEFIQKPYVVHELLTTVRRMLDQT